MLRLLPLLVVIVATACECGGEVEPPPPPIGEGDPIGPPDAGEIYEIDAGPVVCTEDDLEDNDTRADATEVGDDPIEATACGEDDDFFSVQSAPDCNVAATLRKLADSVGDVDMLMFDPDGQLVGSSNNADDTEAINVPAQKTGLYAVRIRPGSRDIVPYEITLTSTCASDLVCPADDANEDNDAAAAPAALIEGVASDGILCGVDEDWFAAPVTLGCLADARLDFVHAQGDVDLELYLADGITRVGNSAGTQNQERLIKGITEPGMRYRVFFFSAEEANQYRFVVDQVCQGQIACPTDDPFEPNDTRGQAKRLFAGLDEVVGTVCASEDFYDVIPTQGCTLHASLSFAHAQGDLDLELQNASNGNVIASSASTSDVEQIDFPAPNANRVALRVFGFGGATNSYRLRLETTCP